MVTRICALDGCNVEFQTDNPRKTHCSRKHTNLAQQKKWRARHKRKGGGGGGGNGGGAPTLFDEIVPQDPQATYVPDTCYRTLLIWPQF
jgi:hypothetical protein